MTGQPSLTRQAQRDLLDIWLHIAAHDPQAADRLYDRIEGCIRILEHTPAAGALRPDIAADARMLVERPYLILYRKGEEGVQIVRVLHGARDVDAALFEHGID